MNEDEKMFVVSFSWKQLAGVALGILTGALAILAAIASITNYKLSLQLQDAKKDITALQRENEELRNENDIEKEGLHC